MGATSLSKTTPSRLIFPALTVWVFITLLALVIVAAIIGAPLAYRHGYRTFSTGIYETFSFVCHQIPERSFHLAGHKFAVCSRCTGLYSGFAFTALVYPLLQSLRRTYTPRLFWLFLAALPLAIDFLLGYFNVWHNNHLSRFVTGALLSSVAVFFIIPGLIELSSSVGQRFRSPEMRSGW